MFLPFSHVVKRFQELFAHTKFKEAAELAVESPKEFFELLTLLLNFRYTFVSRFSVLYLLVLLALVKCFLLVVWCLFAIYMGVQYDFFHLVLDFFY